MVFGLGCVPQAVMTINMFSLQFYISDLVLAQYFVGCCVCVHMCLCYDLFLHWLCVSTAGLDIGPLADSSPVAPQSQGGRRTPRTLSEEPLDGILSPELDKMVTDGQCGRPGAMFSHSSNTGTSHRD